MDTVQSRSRPRLAFHLTRTDLLVLVVYACLLIPHAQAALQGDVLSLIFAVQNLAVLILLLVHRPARVRVQAASADAGLAWIGTVLPLALQPGGAVATPWAGPLLVFGAGMSVVAILSLGRSMGIEPAHRGLQTTWMYRLVRHPIYATYLIVVAGFLLAFPQPLNLGIAALWLAVQVARIDREERLLGQDPAYRAYRTQVRYRLVPFLW